MDNMDGVDGQPSSSQSGPKIVGDAEGAPWYPVGPATFVSVEHPCIVKNIPAALTTLGGLAQLEKLVSEKTMGEEANLCLQPDRMSRNIASANKVMQNLLVQITVPKRTGRRRKKGSQDPFQFPDSEMNGTTPQHQNATNGESSAPPAPNVRALVRALRDIPTAYTVQVLGLIERTHRFRSLPDFVFSTRRSPFMSRVRTQLRPMTYEAAKNFSIGEQHGAGPDGDLIPPPWFTTATLPFNYWYRQGPVAKRAVEVAAGAGGGAAVPIQATVRIRIQRVAYDAPSVPDGPAADVEPKEPDEARVAKLAEQIRGRLVERPLWSRRALANVLQSPDWATCAKRALQYAGYEFSSGPWRDLVCRFGLDPRSDPKYRVYQAIVFQFDAEVRERHVYASESRKGGRRQLNISDRPLRKGTQSSHIFDGISVTLDGKIWQVCDITYPLVADIFATPNIRRECHPRLNGWFHNGTYAKAKWITKMRMNAVLGAGAGADQDVPGTGGTASDIDLAMLATLPDIIDRRTRPQTYLDRFESSQRAQTLAAEIRATAVTPEPQDGDDVEDGAGQGSAGAGLGDEVEVDGDALPEENLDPRLQQALREFTAMEEEMDESEDDEEEEVDEAEQSDHDASPEDGDDEEADGLEHSDREAGLEVDNEEADDSAQSDDGGGLEEEGEDEDEEAEEVEAAEHSHVYRGFVDESDIDGLEE